LPDEEDFKMKPHPTRQIAPALAAAALIILVLSAPALRPQEAKAAIFPGEDWERIEKPGSAGFSSAKLEALRTWLQAMDTTSMMVVVGGRVLFEYGDVSHLSYIASARKSVLAVLYGKHVENGTIALDKTLKDIGLTDVDGLLPSELEATVEHLITARSGVYHPASNAGDNSADAPARGSQRPGRYFLYNNWDFNAAGAAFEKLTGKDIYQALEEDLAKPLGMQDFDRDKQRKSGDQKLSQHLAYHMWLSARDMARLGLLMLRGGEWAGKRVVSEAWVKRITGLVTPLNELNPPQARSLGSGNRWGYGCMWWVWDAPNSPGPFEGAFSAMGAYGQYITVLPRLDMVVVHKTDPAQPSPHGDGKRPRGVAGVEYDALLRMLLAARITSRNSR
jgi:CubicO group peptidase (beta-lactamase class C family)